MTQDLCHSQRNLSAVISRIFWSAMDSFLFREWCTNQPHFFKKSEFRNYELQDRDCWPSTVVCLKSGLQKIRTFAFLRKSSYPKNPDFFVFAEQALSKISGLLWFDRGYFQKNSDVRETFSVFSVINRLSNVECGQSLHRFQLINRSHAFEPEISTFWRALAFF